MCEYARVRCCDLNVFLFLQFCFVFLVLGMSLSDDKVKNSNVLKVIQNSIAMLNLRETLLLKNKFCMFEFGVGLLCVLGFVVSNCVTS